MRHLRYWIYDLRGALLLLGALCMATLSANGQTNGGLTAVITPGYTFQPGEVPSTAKLNLLGMPIIQILGTVGGSNGLAANSVNGNQLFSGIVDGTTLCFNGNNPRQLIICTGGVGAAQINGVAITNGLTNNGTVIGLVVDVTNIVVDTNNRVSLATAVTNAVFGTWVDTSAKVHSSPVSLGLPLQVNTNGVLVITNFTSPLVGNLGTTFSTNFAHGIPTNQTPRMVRVVLVCQVNDNGWTVGQEVPAESWLYYLQSGTQDVYMPEFTYGVDQTNVWIQSHGVIGGDTVNTLARTSAILAHPTFSSWKLKAYVFQ